MTPCGRIRPRTHVGGLAPLLTPRGHLLAALHDDAPALPAEIEQRLAGAFALGAGHGLLLLGAEQVGTVLPPAWGWWRDFAARYVSCVCALAEFQEIDEIHALREGDAAIAPTPDDDTLRRLIADAPPMVGVETLSAALLATLWAELEAALRTELAASKKTLQAFLKARHAAWNLVGRVHFNLAENRKDREAPFAFLATYTSGLSARGAAQHLPLSKALAEFAGGKSRSRLLSLLMPVQRAAGHCEWLREIVEAGDIYHLLRWTAAEAYRFLTDVPQLEAAGIVVRAPGAWRAGWPACCSRALWHRRSARQGAGVAFQPASGRCPGTCPSCTGKSCAVPAAHGSRQGARRCAAGRHIRHRDGRCLHAEKTAGGKKDSGWENSQKAACQAG